MKLSEFDYNLPKELIAQYPSKVRGEDRLLVLDRKRRAFEEKRFCDIADYFNKDELLVLNNTKVIPARLFAKRETGGKVEIFIIDKTKNPLEALIRSSGRIKEGESVILASGSRVRVLGKAEVGRFVELDEPVDEVLENTGTFLCRLIFQGMTRRVIERGIKLFTRPRPAQPHPRLRGSILQMRCSRNLKKKA